MIPECEHGSMVAPISPGSCPCGHTWGFLFASEVPTNNICRSVRPESTWWQPCRHDVRPYILCDAHAVRTCLWYHLWVNFRALFSSVRGVEQLVVLWLADMVHFTASVCPFPAIWGALLTLLTPTARLKKHCTHPEHSTLPHTEEWGGRCGLQSKYAGWLGMFLLWSSLNKTELQ